jgi:hypothetical protein
MERLINQFATKSTDSQCTHDRGKNRECSDVAKVLFQLPTEDGIPH